MLYAAAVSLVCWRLRLLDVGGAVAAAVVGTAAWHAGGWSFAFPLLFFFATSSLLGRLGGKSEESASLRPRTALQVAANGGVAAIASTAYAVQPRPEFAAAYLASLGAATADTWATEIGCRFGRRCVRISTLAPAPVGSSGGVTVAGLVAAAVGAAAAATFAPPLGVSAMMGGIAVVSFAASLADSLLGDLVQGKYRDETGRENEVGDGALVRGFAWMTNDVVNLTATAIAGAGGYFLAAAA